METYKSVEGVHDNLMLEVVMSEATTFVGVDGASVSGRSVVVLIVVVVAVPVPEVDPVVLEVVFGVDPVVVTFTGADRLDVFPLASTAETCITNVVSGDRFVNIK